MSSHESLAGSLISIADKLTSPASVKSVKRELLALADRIRKQNVQSVKDLIKTPNLTEFNALLDEIDPLTMGASNIGLESQNEANLSELVDIMKHAFAELRSGANYKNDIVLSNWIEIFYPKKRKQRKSDIPHEYECWIYFNNIIPNLSENMVKELFIAIIKSNKRRQGRQQTEQKEMEINSVKLEEDMFGQFWAYPTLSKSYHMLDDADINLLAPLYAAVRERLVRYGCWQKMYRLIVNDKAEAKVYQGFYNKWKDFIDVDYQSDEGYTMAHRLVFAAFDSSVQLQFWLDQSPNLSLKRSSDKKWEKEGNTPLDDAKESGKWIAYDMLLYAKMGSKMREKMDTVRESVELKRGMVKQFLKYYKCDNPNSMEYKSMIRIMDCLVDLLNKRLPFSDDLLMLCYHFELSQMKQKQPLETKIWKTIASVCHAVLKLPLNRRDWLWFKSYLMPSALFHEELPSNPTSTENATANEKNQKNEKKELLYQQLVKIVKNQLQAQVNYLRGPIDKLEKSKDPKLSKAWQKLKNYPEFMICDAARGVRQDSCVDVANGKEVMPYPNTPEFSENELKTLKRLSKQSGVSNAAESFDFRTHYDVKGYLSKLKIVAHQLNTKFHYTMCQIMGVDAHWTNNGLNMVYSAGPVKKLVRCQAKAETDYANRPFPSTAQIIDLIRCSMEFSSVEDLLNGIGIFEAAVKSGKTCLKRICRTKNMFLDNKREAGNKWDLYKYADIKMNVLMVDDRQKLSMMVEVQFLMDFMKHAKSLGHGLYEIERDREFVEDLQEVMKIGADKSAALFAYVMQGKEAELSRLMLSYDGDLDLTKFDEENNKSILHWAAQKNQGKIVKYLVSSLSENDAKSYVNLKNDEEQTPLMVACDHGEDASSISAVRQLLKSNYIDINIKDTDGENALHKASNFPFKNKEIIELLLSDQRTDINAGTKDGETAFIRICHGLHYPLLKKIYHQTNIDVNIVSKEFDQTALIRALDGTYKPAQQINPFATLSKREEREIYQLPHQFWMDALDGRTQLDESKENSEQTVGTGEKSIERSYRLNIVKLLLNDPKFNCINQMDLYQLTALGYASQAGDLEIVKLLCQRKDIKHDIEDALSPFACVPKCNLAVLKYLKQRFSKLNINGRNNDESTALIKCCQECNSVDASASYTAKDCLQWLLSLPKIDINAKNEVEMTAFEALVSNAGPKQTALLELFKKLGSKLKISKSNAFAAAASIKGAHAVERCKWLVQNFKKINVNTAHQEKGPLMSAVENDNEELVAYLMQVPGLDVNFPNPDDGMTPIMRAIESENISMFLTLLKNPKIDVKKVDENGKCALHYACESDTGRSFLVEKLTGTKKFSSKEKKDCQKGKCWESKYKPWSDKTKKSNKDDLDLDDLGLDDIDLDEEFKDLNKEPSLDLGIDFDALLAEDPEKEDSTTKMLADLAKDLGLDM